MTFIPLRKKLKSGSRKTAHVGCVKLVYHVLVIFEVLRLYLLLKTYSGTVHQKLSYGESFLQENAMTWSSSSALTVYFLSVFSIGTFLHFFFFFFMHVYVDFRTFISIIFKCYSALTLNLRYRKPPRCLGAILYM